MEECRVLSLIHLRVKDYVMLQMSICVTIVHLLSGHAEPNALTSVK